MDKLLNVTNTPTRKRKRRGGVPLLYNILFKVTTDREDP